METTQNHINGGGGICGTCARPADATPGNEGYSDCCNDRIEYGGEASETLKRSTQRLYDFQGEAGGWYGQTFADNDDEAIADAENEAYTLRMTLVVVEGKREVARVLPNRGF